jgi:3-oxoacyl-[acyl-carrier protein] reductase
MTNSQSQQIAGQGGSHAEFDRGPFGHCHRCQRGIGKGIAKVFAAKGARVLIVARNIGPAKATANEIRAAGGNASAFAADVSSWADARRVAAEAKAQFSGIDILCSNAGLFPAAKLRELTPEAWDEVLGTNLKGTFLTIKACLPAMKVKRRGRIVVTSSITGPITGYPGWSHYGASKAGQLGFMRTAAIELAPHNITINAVMPGNIKTEGLEGMGAEYLGKMTTREREILATAQDPRAGLIIGPDAFTFANRYQIAQLANSANVPAVYPLTAYAAAGGLLSYGIDLPDLHRRAAIYVDRLLKGAKAADLPVQLPTKFELVVNLKTATALGIAIPDTW